MISTTVVREKWKISTTNTKLRVKGSTLEVIHETETARELRSIDISKCELILKGVDADGFLTIEPTLMEKPVFDLSRRRMDIDVRLPPDFFEYLTHITSEHTRYIVYTNPEKHFLLRVETTQGVRTHNLGQLSDHTEFLGILAGIFEDTKEYLHRNQVKGILYRLRVYDTQKMNVGLLVLLKEGIIKRRDGLYGHATLDDDTGVIGYFAADSERAEEQATKKSLENKEEQA